MVRLIDADVYAAEMRKKQDSCRVWKDGLEEGTELYARAEQAFDTFVEAALTLKSQPTIDAIPVEWLKTQINEALDDNETGLASDIDWLIRKYINEQEAR